MGEADIADEDTYSKFTEYMEQLNVYYMHIYKTHRRWNKWSRFDADEQKRNKKPLLSASKTHSQSKEHLTFKMEMLFPEKCPYLLILYAT